MSSSLRNGVTAVAVAATMFFAATGAHAALIGLQLENTPDITSGFIQVDYNAGTQAFTASGFPLTLDLDGVPPVDNFTSGTFDIVATIDNAGNLVGGTIAITGNVLSFSGTLLTGDLTAFGFPTGGGDPFEFLFDVTGVALASLFGPQGGTLMSGTGFAGSWSSNFSNNGQASSDTAPVIPTPSAVAAGLGLMGMLTMRRRRKA